MDDLFSLSALEGTVVQFLCDIVMYIDIMVQR